MIIVILCKTIKMRNSDNTRSLSSVLSKFFIIVLKHFVGSRKINNNVASLMRSDMWNKNLYLSFTYIFFRWTGFPKLKSTLTHWCIVI